METIKTFLQLLWAHWITKIGTVITTSAAIMFIIFFMIEIAVKNPYIGIFSYLLIPAVFILGLVIILLGILILKRKKRKLNKDIKFLDWFKGSLTNSSIRNVKGVATVFALLTMINVIILVAAGSLGVSYMAEPAFCGEVCHSVMHPEYNAYLRSPHAKVECVQCHVGSGAKHFFRSKVDGMRQVISLFTNSYEKPIPTPVFNLRPARETCETCHWTEKFWGSRLKIKTFYEYDESSTKSWMPILINIGGGGEQNSHAQGIHWHVAQQNEMYYIAGDNSREQILWVGYTDENGNERNYYLDGSVNLGIQNRYSSRYVKRKLDCLDCHNRPTHIFQNPDELINNALDNRQIPDDIPFIKREAVNAISYDDFDSIEESFLHIKNSIKSFYQTNYPDLFNSRKPIFDTIIEFLQKAYSSNVFPGMNIEWNSYPEFIGHPEVLFSNSDAQKQTLRGNVSQGCFRCHNERMMTEEGNTINYNCLLCHQILSGPTQNINEIDDYLFD